MPTRWQRRECAIRAYGLPFLNIVQPLDAVAYQVSAILLGLCANDEACGPEAA